MNSMQNEGRTYYIMQQRLTGTKARFDLDNPDEVMTAHPNLIGPLFPIRGFNGHFKVRPRFVLGKGRGRLPRDLEMFHAYWFVSDRLKRVLEKVDPSGVEFAECDIRMKGGEAGPAYWLTDVIRMLDAVDEEKSKVSIREYDGQKTYSDIFYSSFVFRADIVRNAHIFRLQRSWSTIIADDLVKVACRAAGINGISFLSAAK